MNKRMDEYEEAKEQVQAIMSKNNENMPPDAAHLIEESLIKMMVENQTLREMMGYSEDMMEAVYRQGYSLYQNGKFGEALSIFNFLRELDGSDSRYTFAIAATEHQKKNYQGAAGNYLLFETLEPTNPVAYYHLYDCFSHLNQPGLAFNSLKIADRLCSENPTYEELKGKIALELHHLESMNGSGLIKK